ncbi:MAG: hypothetical protein HC800_22190 [Phormidesmis sp. RL_2_1]|nr:hypothetical protein [Phormidesmis sp. RL_2_1]
MQRLLIYLAGTAQAVLLFGSCSKEVIAGISIDNLKEGIASIESRGTGDYAAIGMHTCDRYGLCGRALGRYQMMSYLPEVEAEVWKVQGGRDWLDRINDGYEPSVAEINTYFPKDAQERAFDVEIHQLFETAQRKVDPQSGKLFEGDRLVERVTQTWFSGENGKVDDKGSDDLGRLSVYEYGVESRKYYNSIGGAEPACTAGETTGDFIFLLLNNGVSHQVSALGKSAVKEVNSILLLISRCQSVSLCLLPTAELCSMPGRRAATAIRW